MNWIRSMALFLGRGPSQHVIGIPEVMLYLQKLYAAFPQDMLKLSTSGCLWNAMCCQLECLPGIRPYVNEFPSHMVAQCSLHTTLFLCLDTFYHDFCSLGWFPSSLLLYSAQPFHVLTCPTGTGTCRISKALVGEAARACCLHVWTQHVLEGIFFAF
jgi:hypothetical protein